MQESSATSRNHPSVLQFRQDLESQLRQQVRAAIESVLEGELTAALGSARHERTERREGYRHGALERTITTADGPRVLRVPRGRVRQEDGTTTEFRSQLLPRYARRTRDVDAAIAAEATASWSGLLTDLQRRGLPSPLLVVTDGHAGLKKALEDWSTRCACSDARRTNAATSKTRVRCTPVRK